MKRTNEPTTYGIHRRMGFAGFGAILSIATLSVSLGAVGCKKQPDAADAFVQAQSQTGPDPAAANMAPVNDSVVQSAPPPAQQGKVLGIRSESQTYSQQGESYQNGPAPIVRQAPSGSYAQPGYAQNDDQYYDNGDYDTDVDQGQAALEADQAPPPLPVYTQPEAPEPDDLWTPGYWDYAPQGGYYWVPGAWVAAPYSGALWTPGYWGYYGHRYRFHRGYWGLHIGFYGGIPYGFGYTGVGYEGGYWHENHFFYNRAVNRVNVTRIQNVYVRNVTINNTVINNRVSYNGGPGGWNVRPRPAEIAALRENHTPPMQAQIQHAREAQGNRQQFFDQNRGRPAQVVLTRNLPADRGVQAPPVRGGFGGQRPNEAPNAGPNNTPGATRGGFGQQPSQAQPFQRPGQTPAQQQPGQQQPNQQQPNQRLEQPGQQQQHQPQQQVRPAEPQRPVQQNPQIKQQEQMQQHPIQQPNQRFEPGRQQQQPQQQVRPAEPQRPAQPNPQVQQQQLQQQREAQQQQQRNQQMQQQRNLQQQQQHQPEVQRAPQPQAQPHPQPEARPQPQPQPRPQPQAQPHPQPQPHEEHH